MSSRTRRPADGAQVDAVFAQDRRKEHPELVGRPKRLGRLAKLAAQRPAVEDAAVEGAVLRLRPIMMTTLVATLGLLPAALSRGIGSDSQRPFAIVIVGGLVAALILGVYLLPTLYVWVAGDRDVLPEPEHQDS